MLNNLTKKQEQRMYEVRDEWIERIDTNNFGKGCNKKRAKELIEWLYEFSGLSKPEVLFVESPLGVQFTLNILQANVRANVRDNVGANVWANVWDNVWDNVRANVRDNVRDSVGDNVGANVGANVWANVRDNVRDSVGANVGANVWANVWANVRANVRDNVWANVWVNVGANLEFFPFSSYGNLWDYVWLSFYSYFDEIFKLNNEGFYKFRELIETGIYDMVQLDGLCVVAVLPNFVKRDEQMRMHSSVGPAIKWNDGYELYYLNGVHFDAELWFKIVEKRITAKEVLEIDNQEQKTVAIREFGYEHILKEMKAKTIDKKEITINGNLKFYEVIECDLGDDDVPARFVKVVCHTTEKETLLRVDPRDDQTKTAMGAIAWTADMEEEAYILRQET